uniref:Uncharacterized protein n=1 Tax=viral metagenome TaxID=1070528 RepID=A0A6H1ZVN9_9ZZZZ
MKIKYSKDAIEIFKQFAEVILEDVRKFGVIEEDGQMFIDDGIQRQKIGNLRWVW